MTLQDRFDQLRSLDSSNLGSWPLWTRVGASILLAVVIILAGLWFYVRPKVDTLHQRQSKEPQLKQEFKRKQHKVANLNAYKQQLKEMEHTFTKLLQQLPTKTEEAALLDDISDALLASGLEEEKFKPEGEQKNDFYAVLPISITVVGTYHEMGEFVSRVAALSRIVTMGDVNITPVNNQGPPGGKLRMQATARTYRYIGKTASGIETDGGGSK